MELAFFLALGVGFMVGASRLIYMYRRKANIPIRLNEPVPLTINFEAGTVTVTDQGIVIRNPQLGKDLTIGRQDIVDAKWSLIFDSHVHLRYRIDGREFRQVFQSYYGKELVELIRLQQGIGKSQ